MVPRTWDPASADLGEEPAVEVIELDVARPGDVNRHRYVDEAALSRLIQHTRPDLLDIHEEPFSLAARQWLRSAPSALPTVMYTAQNIDKRFPLPFSAYERTAFSRVSGLYPCSRQAASVARGKGFPGVIEVIPLGVDPGVFHAGQQSLSETELVLGLFGRLVPEKGARDAVQVLQRLNGVRPARLVLAGSGPEGSDALALAADSGLGGQVELHEWSREEELAQLYRRAHVVLVPSRATATWAEQFGRVIVEAQSCGAVVAGYASGAIPEVGGDAAVLVPEGRVELLADAVLQVTADVRAWTARRERGLELAVARTWDRVAERQLALYERVLSHRDEVPLPLGAAARRKAARREFGAPAETPAGDRPFAVWPLRGRRWLSDPIGQAVDFPDRVRGRLLSRE